MRPSHRQPPLLSDSQSQNLSQHVFYTMQRKSLSWVCTEQNPQGGQGLSSGCKSIESFRERESVREREMGCFSQKSGDQCLITLSPSCGLKLFLYHVCKKKNCLLQNWFYFCFLSGFVLIQHLETVAGLMVIVALFIQLVDFNWNDQH